MLRKTIRTLPQHILYLASTLPEGAVLVARDFLHLDSRSAVNQALGRLAHRQQLLRISRGMYALPVQSRFGMRAPSPAKIIASLSIQRGEIITSHSAVAANRLGLTTQVPIQTVYLTSGRHRCLTLGTQTVELIHAPPWQLLFPDQYAGEVIRALDWLGPAHAHHLIEKLPPTTLAKIAAVRKRLPAWLSRKISASMVNDKV